LLAGQHDELAGREPVGKVVLRGAGLALPGARPGGKLGVGVVGQTLAAVAMVVEPLLFCCVEIEKAAVNGGRDRLEKNWISGIMLAPGCKGLARPSPQAWS